MAKRIEEVVGIVSQHIGETFPYYSRLEYPHGYMKRATLLGVNAKQVTIKVEFTDGYRADYCTGTEHFYEHTIINCCEVDY